MKICQVIATNKELGGLERHVVDLSTALAVSDEVHVIGDPLIESLLPDSVRFHPVDMSVSRHNPLLRWKIRKAIERVKPDIVHAQASKATALISNQRIPRVATIHNSKSNVVAFGKFDRVIAVSSTAAEGITGAPVSIIHNGIQLKPRSSDPVELPPRLKPDLPLLLAVGRLVPAKGFDLLISAMRLVNAELWIAGEGPDRKQLESLVQNDRVQDRVQLLGKRSDIRQLTDQALLAVISSRNEGFPYTLVEYLHHRIPVVSTMISGVDQFLPKEVLIGLPNADYIATTINRVLSERNELPSILESAFQFAERELTLKQMTKQTRAVYTSLLTKARKE